MQPQPMRGAGGDWLATGHRRIILIAPAVLLALFMVILPVMYMLMVSFKPPSGSGFFGEGFTLQNYTTLFTNSLYRRVLFRTVGVGLAVSGLCLLLGYPVAYYLSRTNRARQRVLLLLLVSPLYTSIVVRVYAWIVILGQKGLINGTLTRIGVLDKPVAMLNTMPGVMIGLVHVFLPFMVLSLYSILVTVDRRLEEAAYSLGAPPGATFREVILPLSLPGVLAGFLLVFVLSMGAYVVPAALGGPRNLLTSNYIYNSVMAAFNPPLGAAMAFAFLLLTALTLGVYSRVVGRVVRIGGGA